jgi:hypothetical protein
MADWCQMPPEGGGEDMASFLAELKQAAATTPLVYEAAPAVASAREVSAA